MTFKQLKRLQELVSEYYWTRFGNLVVCIDYCHCKEVFSEIFDVDTEDYPECVACRDCICFEDFEAFLENYTDEDIENIFPKKSIDYEKDNVQ